MWRRIQAVSPVPSVPDRVQALVGSCVVIPCSFTPRAPHPLQGRKERVDIRLRYRSGTHIFPLRSVAFSSEDRDHVSADFRGRVSLFGQITDGNCSMRIDKIRLDDARMFEISLKRGGDILWGKPRSFNLDVVGELGSPCSAPFFTYKSNCPSGYLQMMYMYVYPGFRTYKKYKIYLKNVSPGGQLCSLRCFQGRGKAAQRRLGE